MKADYKIATTLLFWLPMFLLGFAFGCLVHALFCGFREAGEVFDDWFRESALLTGKEKEKNE